MRSVLGFVVLVAVASAVKFADLAQGEEFKGCILITDFEAKTLADDVTTVARETNGCCPKGYTGGQEFKPKFNGAQIVCGFKADGTGATLSVSGSNKSCTLNKCYVWKKNLLCRDGCSRQRLNGCCAPFIGFQKTCQNIPTHYKSLGEGERVSYCTTSFMPVLLQNGTATYQMVGTEAGTDDQKDGKLVPANVYTFLPCNDSGVSCSTSSVGKASDDASSFGMMAVAGAALHSLMS